MKYQLLSKDIIKKLSNHIKEFNEEQYNHYIFNVCYYNIGLFIDICLKHWKTDSDWNVIEFWQVHKEIWKKLDWNDDINIIVPRRHWKTTAIKAYILHSLLYEKYSSIIYVSSTWLWEEIIWSIRKELETNNLILKIFWNLVPTESLDRKDKRLKKWRQKELELLNWARIETVSKWMSIRWKSNDLIVVDDPQENKDVESKRITEKFNYWALSSLYNTMMNEWKMITVWTIIWNLCFVKYLRDEKGWETIENKAILENNTPLRPEMWSIEKLEKRKEKIWSKLFNQEFMNIPVSKEETIIKSEWIKYYDQYELDWIKFDSIIMAVDPALWTKEHNDFTWICIVWKVKDFVYVLHSEWVKKTPENLKIYIQNLYNNYKPELILIENVAFQDILRQDLALRNLPIKWIRPDADKHTRLLRVSWQIEFWNVKFRSWWKDEELIYQLTEFPSVKNDDIMDWFVYCITGTPRNKFFLASVG